MARKPRIHITGAVYHVMLRGNGGQTIFFDSKDYSIFEQLVAEGVTRFNHQIHAYCWMPNHVHMVVEVADTPLSKIIQNLSFRHTRWINKRKKRTGHLFQGRYKSILIDTDNYLLELIRYIHLNPVRSNLVQSPSDYQWSGHQAYLGTIKIDWLSTDWVLRRFNRRKSDAGKEYCHFVSRGLGEKYRKEFHMGNKGGVALGDEEFLARLPEFGKSKLMQKKRPLELSTIKKQVCDFYQVPESSITSENRSHLVSRIRSVVALLHSEQAGNVCQAADFFGKEVSTISRQLNNLRQILQTDKQLQQEIEELKSAKTQA